MGRKKSYSKYQSNFIELVKNKVAKAINDYKLIDDGDRVLVAISGGKDSLCLLENLVAYQKFKKVNFQIGIIHINLTDMDYEIDKKLITEFCSKLDLNINFVNTFANIESRGKKSACFICSRNRRKTMFQYAKDNNFNKIAFGHHMDDAVETLIINMIYHANAASIPASLKMFSGEIEIIRPLILLTNKDTTEFAKIKNYPPLKKTCPYDDKTMRTTARNIIKSMEVINPNVRPNLLRALKNIDHELIP
ncbi:MAG: tRNA 2-thiocytidine(32) synthetase TtcA [Marinilabiliales bacterium]|nr:MAG: tRNA 2-thiocytidine(32) synthetase TtcA [Marinilabiliales bacterium]